MRDNPIGKRVLVLAWGFALAILLPAGVMTTYQGIASLKGVTDVNGWLQLATFLANAVIVSAAHVVGLGLPAFFALRRRLIMRWWKPPCIGFLLACIPVGIWAWPYDPASRGSGGYRDGDEMVMLWVDGIPTLAGWLSYAQGVAVVGSLGALAGAAFWWVARRDAWAVNAQR